MTSEGRVFLRRASIWIAAAASARSRYPVRLLSRPLPGLFSAAAIVPITGVSLVVSEFPLHVMAAQVARAIHSWRKGALRTRTGRLALIVAVIAWAWLLASRADARRADAVLADALLRALGEGYLSVPPPDATANSDHAFRDVWFPRFTRRRQYLQHENLTYGDRGVRNNLDIWRRADLPLDARAPVLIQIHGSAWVKGSKRGQGYPLMAHMAERGWVCVAINYALAPAARWPAHIIDVKRAIAWVKREIASFGGDPDFVVVTGGSAGGHLSALAAVSANNPVFQPGFESADTSVQAAVPLYGVYDLLDRAGDSPAEQEAFLRRVVIGASHEEAYEIWDAGSPLSHVRPDAPPVFIIHGSIDTFTNCEQARHFATALREVSANPVAYAELPGAQHAFDIMPTIRTAATVRAIDRFLTLQYQCASKPR